MNDLLNSIGSIALSIISASKDLVVLVGGYWLDTLASNWSLILSSAGAAVVALRLARRKMAMWRALVVFVVLLAILAPSANRYLGIMRGEYTAGAVDGLSLGIVGFAMAITIFSNEQEKK